MEGNMCIRVSRRTNGSQIKAEKESIIILVNICL